MTIQQALTHAIAKLRDKQSASPVLDAEVLLASILKTSKEHLLAIPEKRLTKTQRAGLSRLVGKRAMGWPIAYLTGHKEFYGLDFIVSPDVLVPRPETETLIDAVLKNTHRDTSAAVADVGTGSGCIAVTLARFLTKTSITATDVSPATLKVARKNVLRHHVGNRVRFLQGDLLVPAYKKKFDVIVANLPYLTADQLKKVSHEPRRALHGGRLGLEQIDRLVEQAPKHLQPHGMIFLEIDPRQVAAVEFILRARFPEKKISIIKDLAGRERVVMAR